jgi:hypothetical protein
VDEQGERHTGTVRLTVSAVNDLPQATDDQYVLPTSGPLVVTVAQGVLANDFDLETSDSLAAVLVDRPEHGTLQFSANGSFTYTPLDSFLLEDRFTYQASDGLGRSETQTVVIRLNVPSVEVGSHTLRANTPNQRIDLFVSGGQLVAGLDLYAQVGDGGPERTMLGLAAGQDGPAITHVELKQGTIFSNVPDAVTNLGSLPQVASWSVSLADGGSVAADGLLATLIVDTTGFFDGTWDLRLQNVLPDYDLGPLDSRFASMLAFITNGSIEIVPARVLNRQVFYNHSAWDGNDPLANASDDQAIASNKQALLPGQTASFANYTSYSRGLNGIMVDIAGLPADWEPSPADFELRVGRVGNVSSWTTAPAPTFSLRRAAGVEGSDRVTLTWPDHAIQNAWLEVRVKAGERTLLGRDDLFYFGNAMGETGTTPGNSFVTSIDVIGTRDHQRGPFDLAPIDDVYDFNRDRIVSSSDVILARDHQSGALNSLPLITVPDPANALAMLPMLTSAPSQSVVGQPRVMGDVNHDGRFDSADLVMVFQQGKYGTAQDAVWADGDWDGDGDFDHEDLIAAFQASDSKPSRRVQ